MITTVLALSLAFTHQSPPDLTRSGSKPKLTKAQASKAKVDDLFRAMIEGRYVQMVFPHQLGWPEIPEILNHAESATILRRFPFNPLSSQKQFICSEGIVALWLVEGIRKGSKFPSNNPLCLTLDAPSKDWEKQSEANHPAAATAYKAWWEQVKDLKHKDAALIDPFKGTNFHWH